jgi:hypothetical protein
VSYVPNSLSASELSEIRAALEVAQSFANRIKYPAVLLSDLTPVAMTRDNATMGLEVIQPNEF